MTLQKMIRVGNSWAITIPKSFLDQTKTEGDQLIGMAQDPEKKKILLDFAQEDTLIEETVDKEVYAIGKKLLKHYLPAFKELAKK
jgi:antitoxin component of MazEF toxin-antitoxin module